VAPALLRLQQCYEGQGIDKEDSLYEIVHDPAYHVERVKQLVAEIDEERRVLRHFNNPEGGPGPQGGRRSSSASEMMMENTLLNLARKAKDKVVTGQVMMEEDYTLLRKAEKTLKTYEHVGIPPQEGWFTSNRLHRLRADQLPMADTSAKSTAKEIAAGIQRSDYVHVSQLSLHQLQQNLYDPPMQSIFRSSIINVRHFPRINEFKVRNYSNKRRGSSISSIALGNSSGSSSSSSSNRTTTR